MDEVKKKKEEKRQRKKKATEEKKGRLFWNIIHPCQSPKELTRVSTKVMSYQSKSTKIPFDLLYLSD
jgi:hypothetical protein